MDEFKLFDREKNKNFVFICSVNKLKIIFCLKFYKKLKLIVELCVRKLVILFIYILIIYFLFLCLFFVNYFVYLKFILYFYFFYEKF